MTQKARSAQVVVKNTAKQDIGRVINAFKDAGFTVGPAVANNFSITGPALEKQSAATVLASVHPGVRDLVEDVVFPKPPDFGPGADV